MTYPPQGGYGPPSGGFPQQPPNPYGQVPPPAPQPYGPPDPYGQSQQPYGQPAQPYGQPPQSDPYGTPAQQPYGQQPPNQYGQIPPPAPQQFGQQDPYGQFGQPQQQFGQQQFPQQPYGQPGGQPPKGKGGLVVGIAIGAVVLIGAGIGVVALTSGGSSSPSSASSGSTGTSTSAKDSVGSSSGGGARDAAEAYVAAVQSKDESKARSMLCTEMADKLTQLEKQIEADPKQKELSDKLKEAQRTAKTTMTLKDVTESGSTATATLNVKGTVMNQAVDQDSKLKFEKKSGKWQVCDMGQLGK